MVTTMGRPRENENFALDQRVHIPVSKQHIDYIESVRGKRSRARYVRDLIKIDALEKGKEIK